MNTTCVRLVFTALIAICLSGFAPDLAAQGTTNATHHRQPDRWLLILDTSSAMQRRAKAVEGILGELLASGMRGQMQAGDEIGLWTFDKELRAGVAPLQRWQPGKSNVIADRTVKFLSQQPYRNKSRLETVFEELPRIVAESHRLTVVLFSDGSGRVTGTPFDDAMNEAYAKSKSELGRNRMPLVTVLRSQRGKYVGQSVSFAPWPVEFPPFPELEKPAEPAATNTTAIKPAATAKAIIIRPEPKKEAPVEISPAPAPATQPAPPPPVTEPPPHPTPAVAPVAPPAAVPPATPLPPPPTSTPKTEPAATPAKTISPPPDTAAPGATLPPAAAPATTPPPVPAVVEPPRAVVAEPATPPDSAGVSAPAPAPVPTPVLATGETVAARKWPLILGIGFMWAAVIIALVLVRRSRRPRAASLITESFERRDK